MSAESSGLSPKAHAGNAVQEEQYQSCPHPCLPSSPQHPATGLVISAFGSPDPFPNLQCLHSLLPKQVFHQLWGIFHISSSYKLQAHHKTHYIYLKSWPCSSARNCTTEQQPLWMQTEFLQRTRVVEAE